MSDGKGSTKNKFEPDRPDHDSHTNRAERYFWTTQLNISTTKWNLYNTSQCIGVLITNITTMLNELQWKSLDTKRKQVCITMFFKIMNNSVTVPITYHKTKFIVLNTRNSYNSKLISYQISSL